MKESCTVVHTPTGLDSCSVKPDCKLLTALLLLSYD